MLALVDADTPVFAAAVSSIDKEEWVARARLDTMIDKIMNGVVEAVGQVDYKLYVSGGKNFRKEIYPQYKANRPPSPEHREACHRHLIEQWDAVETNGYEADDAVGCEQNDDTIIVGIDKDLLQIAGRHYSWPIMRLGEVVRPAKTQTISYIDGLRDFYVSALVGDKSDNILYYFDPDSTTWKKEKWALGAKAGEKALSSCNTEEEMYEAVNFHYTSNLMVNHSSEEGERILSQNLDLLWIWRNYGETFSVRNVMHG